ncbi:MAG: hypothetical protein KAJ22_02685 [Candidatus Izimaplasma sp.]|nr:hypothetical protein [Candidatus Izimaplasma bacterium]
MKKNKKIYILLSLVIIIEVFFYYLMSEIANLDPRIIIFDLRLFYSPALFFSNIALYTTSIKTYLLIFRLVDMIFPFAYALLLIQIFRKFNSSHIIFPFLALVFDLLENTILTFLVIVAGEGLDYFVYLVNVVTSLKFLAIFISIVMIISLLVRERRIISGNLKQKD